MTTNEPDLLECVRLPAVEADCIIVGVWRSCSRFELESEKGQFPTDAGEEQDGAVGACVCIAEQRRTRTEEGHARAVSELDRTVVAHPVGTRRKEEHASLTRRKL